MARPIALVIAVSIIAGGGTAQEKKVEKLDAPAFKVDAGELAREFEKNPKDALRKYDPRATKDNALIEVLGLVASVNTRTKTVTFETGGKVAVVLQAQKLLGPDKASKKLVAQATGRFKSFQRNTVIIECTEANLLRIVSDAKK